MLDAKGLWQSWAVARGEGYDSQPIDLRSSLAATLVWIETAFQAHGDGGVAKGYDTRRGCWHPSYPETTGYLIPSLLNAGRWLNDPSWEPRVEAMAQFLLARRSSEGGVGHWSLRTSYPIVFDTGQVIFGWLAAYEKFQKDIYRQAALKAAHWLVRIQDKDGAWRQHQHLGVCKVIDTRVAWALLRVGRLENDPVLLEAGRRNCEWALRQQDEDGWFRSCAFTEREAPFTHTLVYTAEGLFECARILNESKFRVAAERCAFALLAQQEPSGAIAGRFARAWAVQDRSSCLTGIAQIVRLWLELSGPSASDPYFEAATRSLRYLYRLQNRSSAHPGIYGGIAGSYPPWGSYERFSFPNWASKFYIDALLAYQSRLETAGETLLFYQG